MITEVNLVHTQRRSSHDHAISQCSTLFCFFILYFCVSLKKRETKSFFCVLSKSARNQFDPLLCLADEGCRHCEMHFIRFFFRSSELLSLTMSFRYLQRNNRLLYMKNDERDKENLLTTSVTMSSMRVEMSLPFFDRIST